MGYHQCSCAFFKCFCPCWSRNSVLISSVFSGSMLMSSARPSVYPLRCNVFFWHFLKKLNSLVFSYVVKLETVFSFYFLNFYLFFLSKLYTQPGAWTQTTPRSRVTYSTEPPRHPCIFFKVSLNSTSNHTLNLKVIT